MNEDEDMEQRMHELAGNHAARYLERFGTPTELEFSREEIQVSLLNGWAATLEELAITGDEPFDATSRYFGGFQAAFLTAIFGNTRVIHLSTTVESPETLN